MQKNFPYSKELQRVDFSGADLGTSRNHEDQKKDAKKSLNAKTKTEQNKIELENGCRFTELMHLPYYDCMTLCTTCYLELPNVFYKRNG